MSAQKPLLESKTTSEILSALAAALKLDSVPDEQDLHAVINRIPGTARLEIIDRLAAMSSLFPDPGTATPVSHYSWSVQPVLDAPLLRETGQMDINNMILATQHTETMSCGLSLETVHAYWSEMDEDDRPRHPFAPVMELWARPPKSAVRNVRPRRILPSHLATVPQGHKNAGRLFTPHQPGSRQLILPGLEKRTGPELPTQLYDLGAGTVAERCSQAAPLPLRIFIEAILSVPHSERGDDRPVVMNVRFRDFLTAIYAGRIPSPSRYWPRLERAIEALDSPAARLDWECPKTKRGGSRRIVSILDIPRGSGYLDDNLTVSVHLPPGTADGPQMPDSLNSWGMKSVRAYRALIGLAYRWHDPGRTRRPVRNKKHWTYLDDEKRFEPLTDWELVQLCSPTSANGSKRDLLQNARKTIRMLETAGEIRTIDLGRNSLRILPPKPSGKENIDDESNGSDSGK